MNSPIARRQILSAGLAATSSLLVPYRETIAALQDSPVKRVGLIGTGWYGKADLFRLIQVAPVE
ncbi:MAG: gfo/Idh/MocA family oxidoreductase, partial [Planctomycetota bacterium]